MNPVDDYISAAQPADQVEFSRIRQIVYDTAPGATQGVSYAMPAFLYKGKALLSAMATKHHLSIYPFSGKVVEKLKVDLSGFELTSGSIHFSAKHPIPEATLKMIIQARMAEIDSKE